MRFRVISPVIEIISGIFVCFPTIGLVPTIYLTNIVTAFLSEVGGRAAGRDNKGMQEPFGILLSLSQCFPAEGPVTNCRALIAVLTSAASFPVTYHVDHCALRGVTSD